MDITHNTSNGTCDVSFSGKFTFNDHPGFRTVLGMIEDSAAERFVFHLARVEFVDSAALGMLLLALEASEKHNKPLVLRGAQGQVKKMFEMANFHTLFRIE